MATGTTPRAMAASVLPQPHVATRVGALSMTVSPKACLMVTGKLPVAPLEAELGEQLAGASELLLLPQATSAAVSAMGTSSVELRRRTALMGVPVRAREPDNMPRSKGISRYGVD